MQETTQNQTGITYQCPGCQNSFDYLKVARREIAFCPGCGMETKPSIEHLSKAPCAPCDKAKENDLQETVQNWPDLFGGEQKNVSRDSPTPTLQLDRPMLILEVANHERWGVPKEISIDVDWASTLFVRYDRGAWPVDPQTGKQAEKWRPDADYYNGLKQAWVEGKVIPDNFPMSMILPLREKINSLEVEQKKSGDQLHDLPPSLGPEQSTSLPLGHGGDGVSNLISPQSEQSTQFNPGSSMDPPRG